MIAMTAARLGEPQKAVDVLLKSDGPNNGYTGNGHNRQRDDLPIKRVHAVEGGLELDLDFGADHGLAGRRDPSQ